MSGATCAKILWVCLPLQQYNITTVQKCLILWYILTCDLHILKMHIEIRCYCLWRDQTRHCVLTIVCVADIKSFLKWLNKFELSSIINQLKLETYVGQLPKLKMNVYFKFIIHRASGKNILNGLQLYNMIKYIKSCAYLVWQKSACSKIGLGRYHMNIKILSDFFVL